MNHRKAVTRMTRMKPRGSTRIKSNLIRVGPRGICAPAFPAIVQLNIWNLPVASKA